MRYVGLDPSSSSIGMALIDSDGKLIDRCTTSFRPKRGWNDSNMAEALLWAMGFLGGKLGQWREASILADDPIVLAAVELVSVRTNVDTIRKIAYFEAVCMLASRWVDFGVRQVRVTTARKSALGKGSGGLSKDEAYKRIVPLYGEMGLDEADAVVLALWARNVTEHQEDA